MMPLMLLLAIIINMMIYWVKLSTKHVVYLQHI